jgi:hypothetical protein
VSAKVSADRERLFLLFDITALGGFHIGGALLKDSLLCHADTGGAEDIAQPCMMGKACDMERVFGEALCAVFPAMRVGLFNGDVTRFVYNFTAKESVVKTLERL